MNEMKFRTTVSPLSHQGTISHSSPMLMLGSCFADSVGRKLEQELFDVLVNPFGTLYNPASIAAVTRFLASGETFTHKQLMQSGNLHGSWLAHSSLSSSNAETALVRLNRAAQTSREFIPTASHAVITLGTAYVFSLRSTGEIVANCHKRPATEFTRTLLTVDQCAEAILSAIANLTAMSPDMNFIFTVSPIRHTADGLHGNQISKATLLLAIEKVCDANPGRCTYFPAYEIMLDDLRDYRFYDSDMKHPSPLAVDYIYSLFAESYFSGQTIELACESAKLTRRLSHRHMTDDSASIDQFNESTLTYARQLLSRHPELGRAIKRFFKTNSKSLSL